MKNHESMIKSMIYNIGLIFSEMWYELIWNVYKTVSKV